MNPFSRKTPEQRPAEVVTVFVKQSATEYIDQQLAALAPERERTFERILAEYTVAVYRMTKAKQELEDSAAIRHPAGEGPILGTIKTAIEFSDLDKFTTEKDVLENELYDRFPDQQALILALEIQIQHAANVRIYGDPEIE